MKRAGLVLLAYLAIACWMTWPLASAPARLGTPNMDVYGNVWALAWVAHQASRDPLHLFDANMFVPWSGSLAYAESLLPQALQASPVLLLGGSPLLAYNLVFLLSFGLSGLAAYCLAAELSGSRAAGFLAGLGFGFCAYRWHHVVHLQSLSTQWLPLALLCAHRASRAGGRLNLIGLGGFSLLQVLSSGYYALLLGLAVGVVLAWGFREARDRARLVNAGLALALGMAAALPVFFAHRAVQVRHGFTRGQAEAIAWSARPASYLEPGVYSDLPHLQALHAVVRDREPLFAGSWALLFAALAGARRLRAPASGLMWLLFLLGFGLSLGPTVQCFGASLPGPFSLLRWLPGGALLRTPSRLGVLALLALCVLAAIAWARVAWSDRTRPIATTIAAAWLLAEAYPAELRGAVREMPRDAPTVAWLAAAPRGVVLELPWYEPADSALYLYWSTRHWQPMINGFGSFDPPGNFGLGLLGNRWPSEYSTRVFRGAGIRYVVVHTDRLKTGHRERLAAAAAMPGGVTLMASLGADRVYAIDPAGEKEKPSETEGSSANSR